MTVSRVFRFGCLAAGFLLVHQAAFAQFPKLPGMSKHKDNSRARRGGDDGSAAGAQGVPVPVDSPLMQAFERLGQQNVYRQRIAIHASDPRMEEMMAQMGFGPAEMTTVGDVKQVSMRFKFPVEGQPQDFELRTVRGNGRMAKKWVSPASAAIIAKADAQIAKQLAQAEEQAAKSVARNLANGPLGLVSAAMSTGAAAANAAAAASLSKQVHNFFEWSCMDAPDAAPVDKHGPPPLTDLRVLGDQTVNGEAATEYEFFVRQDGKFQGPVQMFVAKESGLPLRMTMNEPHGAGGMQMDYYGFNQEGDFERPACFAK